MAYCNPGDIVSSYLTEKMASQLTSERGDVLNNDVIESCIADADRWIDSYAGTVTPEKASTRRKQISILQTIYNLYFRRAMNIETPKQIDDSHKENLRFLEQVQSGTSKMGDEEPPADQPVTGGARCESNGQTFTDESMYGF